MQITVQFFSYFRKLIGNAQCLESVQDGSTVGQLYEQLIARFPELGQMRRSTLIAVGDEYQRQDYKLADGDIVSFFPPVQGG
jgi:molybdopterin converting factor small subunit